MEGTIQVNDVQQLGPLLLPGTGLGSRVVGRQPSARLRNSLWNLGRGAKRSLHSATERMRQWFPKQNDKQNDKPSTQPEAEADAAEK